MPVQTQFRVRRKDSDRFVDDVLIHKQQLTIGQRVENDLVLNDPAVAPVHAIIVEKDGALWLLDTLDSHATLRNGITVAEEALADGDVIQIGPYFLLIDRAQHEVVISVERKLTIFPLKTPIGQPASALMPRTATGPTESTDRAQQEALQIFWQKRKREAGKIALNTPLCPSGIYGIGKARFNWRPTLDLKSVNRRAYLKITIAAVALVSIVALFAWRDVFSPAPLSTAHASAAILLRGTARAAVSSCSDCHQPFVVMQRNCTACHDVPARPGLSLGFDSTPSKAHGASNIGCLDCHGEHNGADFHPKDVNNESCKSCHNDRDKFRGRILGTPHKAPDGAPTVGYIRVNDSVKWKDQVGPAAISRFHVDHPYANTKCGYCHKGSVGTNEWHDTPKGACQACHGVSFNAAGIEPIGPNCATCHRQHGKDKGLAVAITNKTDSQRRQLVEQVRSQGLSSLIDTTETPAQTAVGEAGVNRKRRLASNWTSLSRLAVIPWYVWAAPIVLLAAAGGFGIYIGNAKRKQSLHTLPQKERTEASTTRAEEAIDAETSRLPAYPYPKIDSQLCIGCYACIEACPHDVLAMAFDEVAIPVALTQCMDDAGCQAACPTAACEVVNTQRKIPLREMPERNPETFLTNVAGVYVIGDVSRVPLIKNAVNEGAEVIKWIKEDLGREGPREDVEYAVAIIGVGAAGLSAAITARQEGLKCIGIEQNKVLSTVQAYPAGKNVNFKPDIKRAKGPLADACAVTAKKETVVKRWTRIMADNMVEIHEHEICTEIKEDRHSFRVFTQRTDTGAASTYLARRVVIAIGASATPKRLPAVGEDRQIRVERTECRNCGSYCQPHRELCHRCNAPMEGCETKVVCDDKVKYRVPDPELFDGKKCAVVGGGNSAVEHAVLLTGFNRDEKTFARNTEVTLLVRTVFTSDLKFGNKMDLYDCQDAGRIKILFGTTITNIESDHVVIETDKKSRPLPNDYVFAFIGSEWPKAFLEHLKIKINEKPPADCASIAKQTERPS